MGGFVWILIRRSEFLLLFFLIVVVDGNVLMWDRYPPFMERKSGRAAEEKVWQETKSELEGKVPEVRAVYEMLDG